MIDTIIMVISITIIIIGLPIGYFWFGYIMGEGLRDILK